MAAAARFAESEVVPRHGGGPLGVHAASRKIGKTGGGGQERKPVIIYMVSPKVIHVEAHEFMPLVQRLTGPSAGGDSKTARPSTTSGGAAAMQPHEQEQEGARSKGGGASRPPVRVKARALNRPAGTAVSVSVTTARQQAAAAAPSAAASPSGLMFHDLSPLRGPALKGEHHHHHPLVSPGGWFHHVGDHHFLSPATAAALASPTAGFLDIFGAGLSSSQHQ